MLIIRSYRLKAALLSSEGRGAGPDAAEVLHAPDLLKAGIIDEIIPEPSAVPIAPAKVASLKETVKKHLKELKASAGEAISACQKFRSMVSWHDSVGTGSAGLSFVASVQRLLLLERLRRSLQATMVPMKAQHDPSLLKIFEHNPQMLDAESRFLAELINEQSRKGERP
jgi:hypothetical protein